MSPELKKNSSNIIQVGISQKLKQKAQNTGSISQAKVNTEMSLVLSTFKFDKDSWPTLYYII